MRPTLVLTLTAVLSASGCTGSLFGGGDDLASKKEALEAVVKKAEAEATAMAEKLADAATQAEANEKAEPAAGEQAGTEEAAVVDAAQEVVDEHVGIFAERLAKAGFGTVTPEILLPDLLGGLDACDAPLRTKLAFEKGYATLARYSDAKAAKKCLDEFVKLPGAAKFASFYTLKDAYMLELHPRMEAADMNKIRAEFAAAMKD